MQVCDGVCCAVVQAASQCYIDLVVKESDNNVKLIVLDRLITLKDVPAHEKVLQVSSTKWHPSNTNRN